MRSESWTFIWQPNVSIRYLRATSPFRFRPFAFAFRHWSSRTRRPKPARPLLQHLTGGAPKSLANRFAAKHPRQLLDPAVAGQPPDRRRGPPALDPLVDLDVRIGVGGNLREVRNAEDLER